MSTFQFTASAPEVVPRVAARFHERMVESYNTGRYSDVKITCQGREFNAVKYVLCQHSDVFAKMLTGDFKEAQEGIMDLPDDDPNAISGLLEFCHRFTYTLPSAPTLEPLVHYIRLCVVGDKYMIPELRDVALTMFRRACLTLWDKPAFVEAIEEAYLHCAYPVFQKLVCTVAVAVHDKLATKRDQHAPFWEVVLEVPEFGKDMLLAIPTARRSSVRLYTCPVCSKTLTHALSSDEKEFPHDCSKTLFGVTVMTKIHCQDLVFNAEGCLVGGLAHGFLPEDASSSRQFAGFGQGSSGEVSKKSPERAGR